MADNKGGEFEKFMAEAEARDPLAFARARAERAELEALRKDAERYRLLRKYIVDSYIACGSGERLDAEIDAAMLAAPGIGAA
jgi:hypothetical protein